MRAPGDGADAVGVAVEVQFEQIVGIEDARVRPQARRVLVLGAVDGDHVALVGPGLQDQSVNALRAGHRAAVPAAVGRLLGAAPLPPRGVDLGRVRVGTVLEVVHRQQIVGVHDFHDVGGAVAAHHALHRVVLADLLVQLDARLRDRLEVGRVVEIALHLGTAADERLDPLVAEHGADPATARLLQADAAAAPVVPGEVQHADQAVVGRRAGTDDGHVGEVLLVLGIHVGEDLGEHVGVQGLVRRLLDPDDPLLAVDEEDDLPVGLALQFEGVEARELEQRAEVAADVAVDRDLGLRRQRDDQRFPAARVLGGARDRSRADDDLVLRVVPPGRGLDGLPQVPEAEAPPADEDVLHLLGHLLLGDLQRPDVHVERAVVVAALRKARRESHLLQNPVGRPILVQPVQVLGALGEIDVEGFDDGRCRMTHDEVLAQMIRAGGSETSTSSSAAWGHALTQMPHEVHL